MSDLIVVHGVPQFVELDGKQGLEVLYMVDLIEAWGFVISFMVDLIVAYGVQQVERSRRRASRSRSWWTPSMRIGRVISFIVDPIDAYGPRDLVHGEPHRCVWGSSFVHDGPH